MDHRMLKKLEARLLTNYRSTGVIPSPRYLKVLTGKKGPQRMLDHFGFVFDVQKYIPGIKDIILKYNPSFFVKIDHANDVYYPSNENLQYLGYTKTGWTPIMKDERVLTYFEFINILTVAKINVAIDFSPIKITEDAI